MTTLKVMVVKTKFIVAKYNYFRALVSIIRFIRLMGFIEKTPYDIIADHNAKMKHHYTAF